MRVVIIAPGYAPTLGGVESHVTGLARGLGQFGVTVEVWVPDRDIRQPRSDHDGAVLVRRFPSTSSRRFPVAPGLFRFARESLDASSVVHVHSYHNAAAASVLLTNKQVPYVFTPHFHGGGHTPLASLAHIPYRPIGNRLFSRATAVVAVSRAEADRIRQAHPRGDVTVIHNGVNAAEIAAAPPKLDQAPTALILGRLERYKNVDRVLEAFDRCADPGQLVVIGDGPDRKRLTAIARSCRRHTDIQFLGTVPRSEVDAWLRTAHGVVSMSGREAFGLVGLEAAAAGGLAVLSRIAAHREVAQIVDPGVITLCEQPEALTRQVSYILRTPPTSPRQVRDWSDVARDHMAIYRDLQTAQEIAASRTGKGRPR